MAEGKKNRKVGKSKRKPTRARYLSEKGMNATHYVQLARRLNHEMLHVARDRRWFLRHAVWEAMDMARARSVAA